MPTKFQPAIKLIDEAELPLVPVPPVVVPVLMPVPVEVPVPEPPELLPLLMEKIPPPRVAK